MHRHRIRAFLAGAGGGETDVPVTIFAAGQYVRYIAGVGLQTTSLGPGTTVVNAVTTWGDTTGTQLLQTPVLLDASGNMTQLVTLDGQDAPRITATLASASPTTGKLTKWASSAAPWKLDATQTLNVVNEDGADSIYGVGSINGVIPSRWVLGPLSGGSTDNAVVRWDATSGRLVQNSTVTIDDSGNITGVTTLNGVSPGNWVQGPASATIGNLAYYSNTSGKNIGAAVVSVDGSGNLTGVGTLNGARWVKPRFTGSTTDRIATWFGSTADTIQETVTTIDSSGNMGSVNAINGVSPSNWVQGPASAALNRVATFSSTTGKFIQDSGSVTISGSSVQGVGALNSIGVGSTSLSSLTAINGVDPSAWVTGPASSTSTRVATFNGTSGKTIQQSPVTIDASGNIANINTLNGIFTYEIVKGNVSFFGGSTGFVAGFGLPKRASSYRVGYVAFVPVSFGDTASTLSLGMSSSDNNGSWGIHMPNSSAAGALGTGGTWANPGTYTNASFIFHATCVVTAGSGIYNLNLNISSSGSMTLLTGWQMWTYL